MSELKQDQYWMQQAIELAKRGLYSTKPNPNVGCVIVKDNQVIGEGFHLKLVSPMRKFCITSGGRTGTRRNCLCDA